MKTYAIRDNERNKNTPIGYLLCYEKAKEYIIELRDDLDEWEAPLLFQKYVREKNFTIPKDVTALWVQERVIPSGRQNIGTILKNAKMNEYQEMTLLKLSKGKCSQDSCYLEEIDYEDIPEKIRMRSEKNVLECFPADNENIICMFRDNLARKVSLIKLQEQFEEVSYVLKKEELLRSVKVGVGGYSISFNNSIEIPVRVLRDETLSEPIVAEDFKTFVRSNMVDTTKACDVMQCSRQNISYMVNTGKLEPVWKGTKENLFTRGNIERAITE